MTSPEIERLIKRLQHIADVLERYGEHHLTAEQTVTQRNSITYLRGAATVLESLRPKPEAGMSPEEEAMTRPERELLRDCSTALDHWLHQYAPEQCDKGWVKETGRAMMNAGGTLAYIADLQQQIRNVLRKP